MERTPLRLNNFDVAIDGVQHTGPALVLPLRTTDTVAGALVALRRDGGPTFGDEQLDMMAAFTDQAVLAGTSSPLGVPDIATGMDRSGVKPIIVPPPTQFVSRGSRHDSTLPYTDR